MKLTNVLGATAIIVMGVVGLAASPDFRRAVQTAAKPLSFSMVESAITRYDVATKTPGLEDDCRALNAVVMYLEHSTSHSIAVGADTIEDAAKTVAVWQRIEKSVCKRAEDEREREFERQHPFRR